MTVGTGAADPPPMRNVIQRSNTMHTNSVHHPAGGHKEPVSEAGGA